MCRSPTCVPATRTLRALYAYGMVRVRPDVEPLELMPTEMPPPEMVGVLTGTGSAGNGTLTVDDPLLEGVVTVAGAPRDAPSAGDAVACGLGRAGRLFEFLPLVPFETILINHHRNVAS